MLFEGTAASAGATARRRRPRFRKAPPGVVRTKRCRNPAGERPPASDRSWQPPAVPAISNRATEAASGGCSRPARSAVGQGNCRASTRSWKPQEIQSSNEELATLNEELHTRNLELGLVSDDFANLLNSVQLAIVMLGPDFPDPTVHTHGGEAAASDCGRLGRPRDIQLGVEVPELEQLRGHGHGQRAGVRGSR